ncbi:MAG: 3-isopropylmalate dehydratase small subunit [Anaerolineae bacterium]|jgi:3-isopropylmalate/(R)-2-methylmalate dehydratase small subunit|nr:3-isopropylmalate dehydratase small subunit [Anaerolineae bacterium]PKO03306.1 MAG: 3-isopropylmalate dehydratase small subunit [Chloroflexi bacterium HGW-Chloroflexi-5]
MEPIKTITSRAISLPMDDIDTDQIIPARFLKVTDKAGLAANLFSDWRYNADGSPKPEFLLNQSAAQGAHILFTGNNFGCGSSREHAPWALTGFGFNAVVALSFGDIFRNNSLKNGLLPIQVDAATHQRLKDLLDEVPRSEWNIDLEAQTLNTPDGESVHFEIDAFSKTCLVQGSDELGYLMSFADQVKEYEVSHHKGVTT